MKIERATIEDTEDIPNLQKLAYRCEAEIYDDYTIPPLTQTLQKMMADFEDQGFLKASAGGKIIGSVRAHIIEKTGSIGRLIVHPDFQNRGTGTRLVHEIERFFWRSKEVRAIHRTWEPIKASISTRKPGLQSIQ
jgi:GNAT superfamily N-acetyltransferase